MEEITPPDENTTIAEDGCIKCGSPDILTGYPNKLCQPCRDSLIKLNVPAWVKGFGIIVLILLLFSIFEIQENFSAALSLSRAENAVKTGNYLTAQRELEKIISKSTSLEVRSNLIIASFYNEDYITMDQNIQALSGKTYEDTALVNRVNEIQKKAENYFPTDSFRVVTKQYKNGASDVPDMVFQSYLNKFPGDVYAHLSYAARFFDTTSYAKCDALMGRVLADQPDHMPALAFKSIVKRELNQLDSSIYYCDKLLAINHQSIMGLSSKARTLLKQRNKDAGLKLAVKTYALSLGNDPYSTATLALAYHVNGKIGDRDKLFAKADKDSTLQSAMRYVKDITSGKQKF